MKIALDYDGTYTRDPGLWDLFIFNAKTRGHTVEILTMRYPHEELEVVPDCRVVYTCRKAKCKFPYDIYIDDSIRWLTQDSV